MAKKIIGIVGGIGSGKSYISDIFAQLGCHIIRADEQSREAYKDPTVRDTIKQWWGNQVFDQNGEPDRKAISRIVFKNDAELKRLEQLIHPIVGRMRDEAMAKYSTCEDVKAFIWDIPLLYEAGLEKECDAVVFIDCSMNRRLERVMKNRGWGYHELMYRERTQIPVQKKHKSADYVIDNNGDADHARTQVEDIFHKIIG